MVHRGTRDGREKLKLIVGIKCLRQRIAAVAELRAKTGFAVPSRLASRLVIIESPYAGDVERNTEYARLCVRDSLARGEAPIASHLLYTQPGVLRDEVETERQWGIDAGLAWLAVAELSAVYTDHGISVAMKHGIKVAVDAGVPVVYRGLMQHRRA